MHQWLLGSTTRWLCANTASLHPCTHIYLLGQEEPECASVAAWHQYIGCTQSCLHAVVDELRHERVDACARAVTEEEV